MIMQYDADIDDIATQVTVGMISLNYDG